MANFNHPNVMRLIGVVTRGIPVLLVLPLCEYGSLNGFVKRMHSVLNMNALLRILLDVALGMQYLAKNK